METGTRISAAAHAALVVWVAVGGAFQGTERSRALPPVAEVSLISAEDFAALSPPRAIAPAPSPAPTVAPPPPARPAATPPPAPPLEPEPQAEAPAPEPTPEPEPAPAAPPPQPEPAPEPDVTAVPVPQADPSAVPLPRPADRVAPTPVPPPPDGVETAETARPSAAPEPTPDATTLPETQPEAAPEAATTQIITEATRTDERGGGAPLRSVLPQARPDRPTPAPVREAPPQPDPPRPTPTPTPTPTPPVAQAPPPPPEPNLEDELLASIADAVAQAAAETAAQPPRPGAPTGPAIGGGLRGGEAEALRRAVAECWNVGSLSSEALAMSVTVVFRLTRDAVPEPDIRLVSHSGGSEAAARIAFEAARRAIERCGRTGFGLPAESFEAWREVEMTFNPESMRIR